MDAPSVSTPLRLSTPIQELPGVGPRRLAALQRLDIHTISDLIRHLPMRYERQAAEGQVKDLVLNSIGSARGTIMVTRWVQMGAGNKGRFQATLQDSTARVDLCWFNARYLQKSLHPGLTIRVQGKVGAFNGYLQMVNPQWEPLEEPDKVDMRDERLRPIYPATEDMPSARIEELIAGVLPQILTLLVDPLPPELVKAHAMPALIDAFRMAHRPEHEDEAAGARRRLAFNELLLLQLGVTLKKHHARTHLIAPALNWSPAIDAHIRERFPFTLTPAQETVVREIVADLRQSKPMNRLLQGDVGSGKTIVALYAMLLAVANRKQGALMVPTELLAEQHYSSITRILAGSTVRIALLTGGMAAAERASLLEEIESGRIDIVVGTQALLTESVRFSDLGVVVVDEQHRFGVMQRAAFRQRRMSEGADGATPGATGSLLPVPGTSATGDASSEAVPVNASSNDTAISMAQGTGRQAASGTSPPPPPPEADPDRQPAPHYLVMTATPIPRTLSLTVFGDLDISTITGLPPGRTPVTTRVVDPAKADEVYAYLAKRVAAGEQAYVVVPAIDESGRESTAQLKNVRAQAKLLQDKYCRGMRVAAVHGQLKSDTREVIMHRFRAGQVQVLVATTVIEVGVDVPNASIMVVEHAERFGLAQLHQLRGRIGRGDSGKRSLCVFIASPLTEDAQRRMKAIAATVDGFRIAEEDLSIRGMGDFFGTRQHGLPPLRVAQIPGDVPLLQLAKRDAEEIVSSDPTMSGDRWARLRKVLSQTYGDTLGLIDVG